MTPVNIEEMNVLSLRPGDLVVIRADSVLRDADIVEFRKQVVDIVPKGVKVVVLDLSTTWEVYRPVNAPPGGAHPEATAVIEALERAIAEAMLKIGVPQPGYAVPIAEAYWVLRNALAADRPDVLPGEDTPTQQKQA